jgi:hypothetical protein
MLNWLWGFPNETGTINGMTDRRAFYEQALRCIDREENLIHYRMSWGLQWNMGALAALFVLQNSNLEDLVKVIIDLLLAGLGIAVSSIALIAIMGAHAQSQFVMNTLCSGLGVVNHQWSNEFIRPYGNNYVHKTARMVSRYIFLIALALWLALTFSILRGGHVRVQFSLPTTRSAPAHAPVTAQPDAAGTPANPHN